MAGTNHSSLFNLMQDPAHPGSIWSPIHPLDHWSSAKSPRMVNLPFSYRRGPPAREVSSRTFPWARSDARDVEDACYPLKQTRRPSTFAGAVGDGRLRPQVDLSHESSLDVEQTAIMLRSLDLTPPVHSPSIFSQQQLKSNPLRGVESQSTPELSSSGSGYASGSESSPPDAFQATSIERSEFVQSEGNTLHSFMDSPVFRQAHLGRSRTYLPFSSASSLFPPGNSRVSSPRKGPSVDESTLHAKDAWRDIFPSSTRFERALGHSDSDYDSLVPTPTSSTFSRSRQNSLDLTDLMTKGQPDWQPELTAQSWHRQLSSDYQDQFTKPRHMTPPLPSGNAVWNDRFFNSTANNGFRASSNHRIIGDRTATHGRVATEPLNFLHLLHPSAQPPYAQLVHRIVKSSDQQASIFLQQKLKVGLPEDRTRIVDAITEHGFEMMTSRFGNFSTQRCLDPPCTRDDRRKIVSCMRGRVIELATNCYGTHVVQKALDCEEDIRLFIVTELLLGDPATTLINKHASHVWSKIMELTWSDPAPPIFAYVNKSLLGQWATLACHETGSLVVQTIFENLDDGPEKTAIVDEVVKDFDQVICSPWGSFVAGHILEHGTPTARSKALNLLIAKLPSYATNDIAHKTIIKALKDGDSVFLDGLVGRMCENNRSRRAIIVDLALSSLGSQLISAVLPLVSAEALATLYDAVKRHVVTLRGCKTGSRVIWLFDRMLASKKHS